MPFGAIASAVGLGSSVLGALGGGKSQKTSENTTGFNALPTEVKDLLKGDYLDRVTAETSRGYEGTPMRRVGARETDPRFGSVALQDLQRLRDTQTMSDIHGLIQGQTGVTDAAFTETTANQLRNEMLARNELEAYSARMGRMNPGADDRARKYLDTIDTAQLQRLGEYMTKRKDIPASNEGLDALLADYGAEEELLRLFQRGF